MLLLLYELPLFLCSIQLIAIPLAAFSKGRIKGAALDFVFIFGLLGALLGTYGAGNNYSVYPVLSIDNVASGITHSISGFASLYIAISGMVSMKKKDIPITFAILSGDVKSISSANGVGAKTAARVVLELKDKIGKEFPDAMQKIDDEPAEVGGALTESAVMDEARDVLLTLGYTRSEIQSALKGVKAKDTDSCVREALRKLMK